MTEINMKNIALNLKITALNVALLGVIGISHTFAAEVTGVGNFSHVVADMDRAIEFYEEVIGLEVNTAATGFSDNSAIMQMGDTIGAQSNMISYSIPGSDIGIELLEYKDIDRHPVQTRFQDPGAALIQLRLRNMDPILARLGSSAGMIWTPSGVPVSLGESGRIIFLKDPDGYFVELIEVEPSAEAASIGSNIYAASFELIINNTDENAAFYGVGLGLSVQVGDGYDDTPELSNTVNAVGGAFRRSGLQVTGSDVAVNFLEFTNINRKAMNTRIQDPGTAILQIKVDDVAAMATQLVAAGGTLISQGGGPVEIAPGVLIAIIRDPNNLFIELLPSFL